jgi:hypothetical protein
MWAAHAAWKGAELDRFFTDLTAHEQKKIKIFRFGRVRLGSVLADGHLGGGPLERGALERSEIFFIVQEPARGCRSVK